MRIGLRIVDTQSTLNNLKYLNQAYLNPGSTASVWFELVDLDTINQNNLIGTRFIPTSAAVIQASINSVNNAQIVSKVATMIFPNDDRSIWGFNLTAVDTANIGCVNLALTITDGANIYIVNADSVIIGTPASCFQC